MKTSKVTPRGNWGDLFHCSPGGSCRYLLGGTYESLTRPVGVLPGETVDARVEYLGRLLRMAYDDLETVGSERLNVPFRRKLWLTDRFPEFHAKFGIVKHLIFATRIVLEDLGAETDEAIFRLTAVRSTARMLEIVDESPMFMEETALRDLQEETEKAMAATVWLGNATRARGEYLFNITMKLHWYFHIVEDARKTKINPKYFSTPLDEDFVGRIAAVVRACARKNGPSRAAPQILRMYLRLVFARAQSSFKAKWTVGS
jgi:hypothetical protein